jgi:hypothetical protein
MLFSADWEEQAMMQAATETYKVRGHAEADWT